MKNILEEKGLFFNLVKDTRLISHSINVAKASEIIAKNLKLDSDLAYCYGLFHDIGKSQGGKGLNHTYLGYKFLMNNKIIDKPDICLTHSFPLKNVDCYLGENDCTMQEYEFLKEYISKVEYTIYDRIIQLSDAIAGSDGFMILEISMVKVAMKYNINAHTKYLWQAYFDVYNEIEKLVNTNIYSLLNEKVSGYNSY